MAETLYKFEGYMKVNWRRAAQQQPNNIYGNTKAGVPMLGTKMTQAWSSTNTLSILIKGYGH